MHSARRCGPRQLRWKIGCDLTLGLLPALEDLLQQRGVDLGRLPGALRGRDDVIGGRAGHPRGEFGQRRGSGRRDGQAWPIRARWALAGPGRGGDGRCGETGHRRHVETGVGGHAGRDGIDVVVLRVVPALVRADGRWARPRVRRAWGSPAGPTRRSEPKPPSGPGAGRGRGRPRRAVVAADSVGSSGVPEPGDESLLATVVRAVEDGRRARPVGVGGVGHQVAVLGVVGPDEAERRVEVGRGRRRPSSRGVTCR